MEPAGGTIYPGEVARIELRYVDKNYEEKDGNWREEEQRDKAVVLCLGIRGQVASLSYGSNVCVCHGSTSTKLLREGHTQYSSSPRKISPHRENFFL